MVILCFTHTEEPLKLKSQFLPIFASTYYPPLAFVCSHPGRWDGILRHSLNCFSMMHNATERYSMCLLAICVSPLEKGLFKYFIHLLIE